MVTVDGATDLIRDAIIMALVIVGPILIIGMVIGLLISVIQSVTQIQEQTLTFVPKIMAMALAMIIVMPWMFRRLMDYTAMMFSTLP
jgi:flagellar biosynthetic protein FliQ